jgi:hypothetical protein
VKRPLALVLVLVLVVEKCHQGIEEEDEDE